MSSSKNGDFLLSSGQESSMFIPFCAGCMGNLPVNAQPLQSSRLDADITVVDNHFKVIHKLGLMDI